jgi:hypothetical protein
MLGWISSRNAKSFHAPSASVKPVSPGYATLSGAFPKRIMQIFFGKNLVAFLVDAIALGIEHIVIIPMVLAHIKVGAFHRVCACSTSLLIMFISMGMLFIDFEA